MLDSFNNKKSKKILIGVGVFFLYSLVTLFKGYPLQLLGIKELSQTMSLLYSLVISLLLLFTIIFIYRDKLKFNFRDLLLNHKTYFEKYLKYWLLALFAMALLNLIILNFVPNDLPTNEKAIREIFAVNPFMVFVSAVLIAPVLEELVFRQSFRNVFKDDIVFVVVSALVFGSFHVIGSFTELIDFIYIIPYSIPGIAFALMLKETDNVLVPMGFHFLHNGVLIALQFLLLILG
ncbi:MAG: CPBP family intramembrane metalloprotease [Bacilli bacterium]|nr:CPBP family intramembrane metalloprotease [Bacilli bacterium]MDD4547435.1 CPBP family intramembrane metalloprotease [Bacilli bacterium]